MKDEPKIGGAQALRRSIAALIAKGGRFVHPSVWAPFVLVGMGSSGYPNRKVPLYQPSLPKAFVTLPLPQGVILVGSDFSDVGTTPIADQSPWTRGASCRPATGI